MSNAFSALDRLKNRTNSSSEDVKSSNRKLPRSTSANSVFASIPMPRASSSEKSQESNKPLESRVKPSKLSSVLRAQSKFSGQTSVVSSKSTKSLTRSAISKLPLTNRTLTGRSNRLQRTLPWATTSLIDVRSKVKLKEHHIEDKTKYKPKYASAEQLSIVSKKEDPKEYSYLQSIDSNYTEVDLSDEQKHVLDLILNKRKNVFFTGSAGTGKSLLLRVIIGKLKTRYGISNIGICAPTGLAAANIGGKTIQRLFSIGLGKDPADVLLNRIKKNMEKYMVWRRMVVLIVDEVSMLEADLLDKLNYLAKKIKRNDQPFGGIQVIMSGDFLQLPPVTRDPTYVNYCFKSKSWNEIITEKIVLSEVFRQQGDTELVDILNALRIGRVDYHIESKLRKLSRPLTYDDGIQATELFPTRNEVERANLQQLEQLQGPELTFPCKDISTYGAPIDERVMRNFDNLMCSQTLKLKPGAQVMLIKNGVHEDLVNGELGIVEGFVTKPIYQNFIARFGSESIEARSKLLRKISMILLNKKQITNEPENDDLSLVDPLTAEVITQIIRSFDPSDNLFPVVTFQKMNGSKLNFFVEPTDFFYEATPGKDAEFIRQQLPIILSWAMSIHKSQGQTLQRVKVDLRKVFEKGQLYVAISRCVSSNGLQVLNFDRRKVFVDEEVISFYRSLSQ